MEITEQIMRNLQVTPLAELLGGQDVREAFVCMDICEEELAKARLPKARDSEVFRVACPTVILRGKAPDVYRSHVRELIERVRQGLPTDTGTEAEVLCHLLAAATVAPLNTAGLALASHLFARVMPGCDVGPAVSEVYQGQIADDLAAARKRATVKRGES